MTKQQISSILSEIGNFSLNEVVDLKDKVQSIILASDECLYPDKNTRFEFHTKNSCELLLVYTGRETEDGTFIFKDDLPEYFIPFAAVVGINMLTPFRIKEPYRLTQAV